MFQSKLVPAPPVLARLRTAAGPRTLGLGLALLIEALLLLVLLTLNISNEPEVEEERPVMTALNVRDVSEDTPEPPRAEPEPQADAQPEARQPRPDEPRPPQPAEPPVPDTPAAPPAPALVPMRWNLRPPNPFRTTERPAAPARPLYGPPDVRSAAMRDTERVGTAPNGEPLYAAEWYREPDDRMMRDYLSTARGPGSGLIACRTVADYRVEDCVALSDYPEGSQITRSALAAAWEFRVRPPRRGGQVLVGSWVRIRIDYQLGRR